MEARVAGSPDSCGEGFARGALELPGEAPPGGSGAAAGGAGQSSEGVRGSNAANDTALSRRVAFTILGEPASKANSREIVSVGKRPPWQDFLKRVVREEGNSQHVSTVRSWIAQAAQVLNTEDTSRWAVIKSSKARAYEDTARYRFPRTRK
jgi:hypothetical protein